MRVRGAQAPRKRRVMGGIEKPSSHGRGGLDLQKGKFTQSLSMLIEGLQDNTFGASTVTLCV